MALDVATIATEGPSQVGGKRPAGGAGGGGRAAQALGRPASRFVGVAGRS